MVDEGKAPADKTSPAERKAEAEKVASGDAAPPKRKVVSRRVTTKGGGIAPSTPSRTGAKAKEKGGPTSGEIASRRYTPPSPHEKPPSPMWVPILMFALIIVGALVIILNYVGLLGDVNNIKLVIGLGLILGGIITATQYR